MSVAIVTGSAGLIGAEACRHFADLGMDVVGLDNDMRGRFFGREASTRWQRTRLELDLGAHYTHADLDVRDEAGVSRLFRRHGPATALVLHTAAQPSHDWAARDPRLDFSVNAQGTLNLLEATRQWAPYAVFIFTSTNKVYGDQPNRLPLVEQETRFELAAAHPYEDGIREDMSIDQTLHSVFGASKVAADVMVQEYGRYFDLASACFRGGCLTGPNHSGTALHGFLAYLMRCIVCGTPYTVFGHGGKQVRDNIHSADLVRAFECFFRHPRCGEVYNIGGGRHSHCSMREAIGIGEAIVGRRLNWTYSDDARKGDHRWWVSGLSKFRSHYPDWSLSYDVPRICREIFEANVDRWSTVPA